MPLVSTGPSSSDHLKNRNKWRMSAIGATYWCYYPQERGSLSGPPVGSEGCNWAEVQAAKGRVKAGSPSMAVQPSQLMSSFEESCDIPWWHWDPANTLRAYRVCCSPLTLFYSQQLSCGQELQCPLADEETEVTACPRPQRSWVWRDSGQPDFLGQCPSCSWVSAAVMVHTPISGNCAGWGCHTCTWTARQGWAAGASSFPGALADMGFPSHPGFSAAPATSELLSRRPCHEEGMSPARLANGCHSGQGLIDLFCCSMYSSTFVPDLSFLSRWINTLLIKQREPQ